MLFPELKEQCNPNFSLQNGVSKIISVTLGAYFTNWSVKFGKIGLQNRTEILYFCITHRVL